MSESTKRAIVVCGHLCLDIIPGFPLVGTGQDWFRPGRLSVVGAPVISTGGAVSNVGLALHRLGLPVHLIARIGNDPLGRLILEHVRQSGSGLSDGIRPFDGEITSYTVVVNPPGIDRIFFHCPGANDRFSESDVDDAALDGAALFHLGYPPLLERMWSDGGVGLSRLLQRARALGALTSLDMSLPDPASPSGRVDWRSLMDRVLPSVDLFEPSIEELLFMVDRPRFNRLAANGGGEGIIRGITFAELSDLADRILASGISALLIKLGERGAYLRTAGTGPCGMQGWEARELYSPVFHVPSVKGTTGAGDSTIAGFLASVFKGLGPVDSLTMAVAVGGCCVEAADATSGVRAWEETRGRVRQGWERAASPVAEKGWRTGVDGLWHGPADRDPLRA